MNTGNAIGNIINVHQCIKIENQRLKILVKKQQIMDEKVTNIHFETTVEILSSVQDSAY